MKAHKVSIRTQIPSAWLEQFEQLAEQAGRSTGELVKEALEQYLMVNKNQQNQEFAPKEPSVASESFSQEIKTIKAELVQLTQQVAKLSNYSQLVTTTSARLTVLERLLNNSNSTVATMTNSSVKEVREEDDDDDCDEPDEILTDFLPREKW
jgi:metal-responsive CopG/Arc/MetJ family transcriptional regulator